MLDRIRKSRRKAPQAVPSHDQPLRPRTRGDVPEWETARWKHQVEAEARHRLKKELHGDTVD
jgi:hypothetical protein